MEILFNVIANIFIIAIIIIILKWAFEDYKQHKIDSYNEKKMKKEKHYAEIQLIETEIMNYKREIELKQEMINLIKKKGEKYGRLHRSNTACSRNNKDCNTIRIDIKSK